MNERLLPLFVAILATVSSPALGQEAGSPEAAVRAFHEALASGNSATALTLPAEDVVIFESGGVEASREAYRSHQLPADMAFASSTQRQASLDRSGRSEGLAWVLSRSTTTGTFRRAGDSQHRNRDDAA